MNIVPDIKNQEYLKKAYLEEGKSTYKIAEECGVNKSTAYYYLKKSGLIGIKSEDIRVKVDEKLFRIDNPIFCYYAGLVSADGYLDTKYHRVVLRMKNEDWNEMFQRLRNYFKLSSEVKVYRTVGYSGEIDMCDLTISSQKLLDTLKELNITHNKKDLKRRFPDMNKLSDECQEMYIRGLMDGDGTLYSRGELRILEESEEMVGAIIEFLKHKFSIECKMYNQKTNTGKDCKYISIKGKKCIEVLNWLYRNELDYKLQYKYVTYMNIEQ